MVKCSKHRERFSSAVSRHPKSLTGPEKSTANTRQRCLGAAKRLTNQRVSHQDGVRSVDCDLVVRGVAAGQSKVEVLNVEVHVGQDELALDVVPGAKKQRKYQDEKSKLIFPCFV